MNRTSVRWLIAGVVAATPLLQPEISSAVMIATATGNGNRIAFSGERPADDPGVNHVGYNNIGSAVYLGYGFVLTAGHITPNGIQLTNGVGGITTYLHDTSWGSAPDQSEYLKNSFVVGNPNSDVHLFRILGNPGLAPLTISSVIPPSGSSLVVAGASMDRQAPQFKWDVDTSTPTWTWTEIGTITHPTDDPLLPNGVGYKPNPYDGNTTLRWGTNNRELVTGNVSSGGFNSNVFTTMFDDPINPGVLSTEAQGQPGDSGGAAFYKNGSNWELSGISILVDIYSGQPYGPGGIYTGVFGNETYYVNLAAYKSQIDAFMQPFVPEPSSAFVIVGCFGALLARRSRRLRTR